MLIVVRHGRTAWNAAGRFQGWADVPLDPEGRRQSQQLAATLVAHAALAAHRPHTRVVSSDLRRAVETAEVVAAALGVLPTADAALREVDVGAWEGLTRAEVEARFPDELRRWSEREDVRRGGGETRRESGIRVADCLGRLLAEAEGLLIVVGHGVSLQAGLEDLAARRILDLGGSAPHLGNARFLVLATPGTANAGRAATAARAAPTPGPPGAPLQHKR